ncbi:hypothetical protein MTR67_043092, partial [Solanum verrucosum]
VELNNPEGSSAGKGLGQSPSGRRFEPQQGHWRHYKPAASPGPRGTNRGGPALKQRDPVGTASRVRKATPGNHELFGISSLAWRGHLVHVIVPQRGGDNWGVYIRFFMTINNSLHLQLGLALASLGVITSLVAQHMYSLPAFEFIAQDFTTQVALYTHHLYIAEFIMIGAFAHGAIFLVEITIWSKMKIMYCKNVLIGTLAWAHERTHLANLIRWRVKPLALSILQEILVGLAHFSVVFLSKGRELTIETLAYADTYFVKWFMHVCCQNQQDQVGKD